jgi:hypothetical protein
MDPLDLAIACGWLAVACAASVVLLILGDWLTRKPSAEQRRQELDRVVQFSDYRPISLHAPAPKGFERRRRA